MSNFILPKVIAAESLRILTNELVVGNMVYRGDTSAFTAVKQGDTVTIRKPASFEVKEFTGTTEPQGINEGSTSITLEKHFDTTIEITSKEMTLELNDFAEQVIKPVMLQFAETIDSYLCSKYAEVNDIIGSGTASIDSLVDVDTKLMEKRVPAAGRAGLVGPVTKGRILKLQDLYRADARGDAGTALRTASMGEIFGVDYFAAQGVKRHEPGNPGAGAKADGAKGATQVAISGGTAGGTFKRGDVITFAGGTETYSVLKDVTLSGAGAGILDLNRELERAVSAAAVSVAAAHYGNLVGNFRGLSLAVVPLALPIAGSADAAIVNYNGLAIRVVRDYDSQHKMNTISFDALLGAKVTDPRLLARYNG